MFRWVQMDSLRHTTTVCLLPVQDELVEIQTFCVENAKIKEANALFRLLKTLDNEQGKANKC